MSAKTIDDLPAFCVRALSEADGPIHGEHGLTPSNICSIAENRGYERPTERAVARALSSLSVTRKRMWHSTWYRLVDRDASADTVPLTEYENMRAHRDRLWRERDEARASVEQLDNLLARAASIAPTDEERLAVEALRSALSNPSEAGPDGR